MPEMGYKPTNKYLPPRKKTKPGDAPALVPMLDQPAGFLGWVDRLLSSQ
jgi:hypothetical protein